MEELLLLGISPQKIKEMILINPMIKDMDNDEIKEKVSTLKTIGCTDRQICNIISTNSMYLDSVNDDVLNLISYLKYIGFSNLNDLFDSNPFILNLFSYEIKDYINKRVKNKELLEDIVDDLESNPFLFDEI